jgi:hypothetical protein
MMSVIFQVMAPIKEEVADQHVFTQVHLFLNQESQLQSWARHGL